jgi:iron-sulfur cluster repair protein YtfE (RIC family)
MEEQEMSNDTEIDPTMTVKETMALYPNTRNVFNHFGVDTCCGSGVPIVDAAHRDGAELTVLLAALRDATT